MPAAIPARPGRSASNGPGGTRTSQCSTSRPTALPDGGKPGRATERPLLTQILTRENWIVGACLLLLCGAGWWWLVRMAAPMSAASAMEAMAGMGMRAGFAPWSLAYLGPAFAMWTIMMAAMMLPSAAPMILLYASFARRTPASARMATAAFALTYLLLWAGFAALATVGQAFLIGHGLLARASLAISDRTLVALLLAAVALYQLSGLKRLCLSHCRSPVGFLMRYWRPGVGGAVRMGIAHGLYCLGCCSLLMLLLFAGGVMNLLWVAFLTLVVVAEKYAPREWHLDWLIAAALLVTSCALLVW